MLTLLVIWSIALVCFWLAGALLADATAKKIVQVVIAFALLVWLVLTLFGHAPHVG